mgnify:CR=1 FL=1
MRQIEGVIDNRVFPLPVENSRLVEEQQHALLESARFHAKEVVRLMGAYDPTPAAACLFSVSVPGC